MDKNRFLIGFCASLFALVPTVVLAEDGEDSTGQAKDAQVKSDAPFEWSDDHLADLFPWSSEDMIFSSDREPSGPSKRIASKARPRRQDRNVVPTSVLEITEPTATAVRESHTEEYGSQTENAGCACGVDNGSEACDCEKQAAVAKAVSGAHKGVFYNNNFNYLCDPCYDDWILGDELKRQSVGECITYDFGGQYRMRYHNERNMRGLGPTGNDDRFLLHRLRFYANVEIGSRVRLYGEIIDAVSEFEASAPRPIEENRTDILNLFVDYKLYDGCCGDLWGRFGRQELLYGAQRVISPLDWANTRRTFEGGKLMWTGPNWDIDAFWTRPVPDTTANVHSVNSPDQSQEYMGVYSTYKGLENETLDIYYTRYIETDGTGFEFNTAGGRWTGSHCAWLWDIEAAIQYGDVGNVDNDHGFYTIGFGHKLESLCWQPTFWTYFDWASGENAGPAGTAATNRGYHQQFPLGHKYLGFMDLFGRRNIEDLNFLLTANPTSELKLLAWYHIFHLQDNDVPYNVVMGPSATVNGGDSSLGQELDLMLSWNYGPRQNLILGYSHFFAGDFYSTNGSAGLFDGDADFYYTQMTVNF